jgi:hypothetical protein
MAVRLSTIVSTIRALFSVAVGGHSRRAPAPFALSNAAVHLYAILRPIRHNNHRAGSGRHTAGVEIYRQEGHFYIGRSAAAMLGRK